MPSPVESAVGRALRTARAVAALPILYRRGGATVALSALRSDADVQAESADGTITIERIAVWRVMADELVMAGQPIRPQTGDRIEVVVDSRRQTFVAMHIVGDRCYEPTDPWSHGYKIHTKLVEEKL